MAMSRGTRMMAVSRMTDGGGTRGFNGTGRSEERYDYQNMPGREPQHDPRRQYDRENFPDMTENRYYGEGGTRGGYDMPESRRGRNGRFVSGEGGGGIESRMIGYDRDEDEPMMHYGGSGNGGKIYAEGSMVYEQGKGGRENLRHGGDKYRKVDEHMADAWVKRMQNADGSTGPKFKIDQTESLRQMYCMECDKWEFFVVINMMYSDYCEVARHMGVDRVDYYAMLAKAFLCDEDAGDYKLQKYMEKVVK